MKLKNWAAAAMALTAATMATSAEATVFSFELNGAHRAVWTIDTDTPVSEYDQNGNEFANYGTVLGNFSDLPGFGTKNYVASIDFYTDALGGGFNIDDYYNRTDPDVERPILNVTGASLISGPTSAPTFVAGSYILTNKNNAGERYSLLISAIPEPASWAMMLVGFGAIGVTMRRRTKGAVTLLA
jgi:hypothetical protein